MTEVAESESSTQEPRRLGQLRVLLRLTHAGVRYALLRGGPGIGNDLDLVVHPSDLAKLAATLGDNDLYSTPSRRHWPHRFFVGRHDIPDAPEATNGDTAGGEAADPETHGETADAAWIVIDVVDHVVISGAFIGDRDLAATLAEAAVRDEAGVMHLAPADAAWAVLIHAAAKGRSLDLGPSLDALDAQSALGRAVDARLGLGRAGDVLAALRTGDEGSAASTLRSLADVPWPSPARSARALHKWLDRLMWPRRPVRRVRGLNVALLGPDGAGKSTLAEGLRARLPVPVRIVYMGVFRTDATHRAWRKIPGGGLLLRLSKLWWRSTLARYHRARGGVVVFDRYVFDAALRPGNRGFRSRASYWVIERACPQPDLVLLLDAPGAVMFARKGEHDVATLEQRRGWYLDLVNKLPQGVVIDATMSPSRVLDAAVAAVWKAQSAA